MPTTEVVQIQRILIPPGARADQPLPASAPIGAIYCITDEENILEYNTGAEWLPYGLSLPAVLTVLAADPSSPVDGTGWFVLEGTSPTASLSFRTRVAGTTVTIPLASF